MKQFYGCDLKSGESQHIQVCSLPFLKFSQSPNHRAVTPSWIPHLDSMPLPSEYALSVNTDCEAIYFFGMINSNDQGCGSWYVSAGNKSQDFFIGDAIGELTVEYSDKTTVTIPLVIGFTSWWYTPWISDSLPFGVNGEAKDKLMDSLYISDIFNKRAGGYVLAFRPKKCTVERIVLKGNPNKAGYPVLWGITLQNPTNTDRLIPLSSSSEPEHIRFLDDEYIRKSERWQDKLEKLKRTLYTFEDELPDKAQIRLEIPDGYTGPVISLNGDKIGAMISNQFINILGQIILKGDEGCCESYGTYRDYYHLCIGMYQPQGATGGRFWTRDLARVYIERMRAGALDAARKGLDVYGRLLYGYKDFIPKPMPHWVQAYYVEPVPEIYKEAFGENALPPVYGICHRLTAAEKEPIEGNIENDGHGLMLLAFYQYYIASGRDKSWLEVVWRVIQDGAEWICWQIDNPLNITELIKRNPDFDQRRIQHPGLLWSENESANYGACDTWNNAVCYYALKACAKLANVLCENSFEEKYDAYAKKLWDAMVIYLTEEHPEYGKVWTHFHRSHWQDFNESLSPLFCAVDVFGLNTEQIEPEAVKITHNTYRMLINRGRNNEKLFDFTRAFGYGQSFIMETALMLDEAEDFEQLIRASSKYMYSKREHQWLCAEGAVVHESGEYWYRHNGIGNEIQVASIVRTIRMMFGMDDTNPDVLYIAPRVPDAMTPAKMERYMVHTMSNGKLERCIINMYYSSDGYKIQLTVSSDRTLDCIKIRLIAPVVGVPFWVFINGERWNAYHTQVIGKHECITIDGLRVDGDVHILITENI